MVRFLIIIVLRFYSNLVSSDIFMNLNMYDQRTLIYFYITSESDKIGIEKTGTRPLLHHVLV